MEGAQIPAPVESWSSTRRVRARSPEAKAHVLRLAEQLGSVSRACRIMGYSRDSFYRFKRLYDTGGLDALECVSQRRPLLKNRVDPNVERKVLELAKQAPTWGRVRVSEFLAKQGMKISPSGVRCVWVRHGLETARARLGLGARTCRAYPEALGQP